MEAVRSRGAVVMCGVLAGLVYRENETKERLQGNRNQRQSLWLPDPWFQVFLSPTAGLPRSVNPQLSVRVTGCF